MLSQEMNSLMERHEAFWAGGGDGPLRRVTPYAPLREGGGIPLADGSWAEDGRTISPDLIAPRRFYEEDAEPTSVVNGDFIVGKGPPGLCWTEAILGCTVRMVTGGPWAESFFGDWAELEDLEPGWFERRWTMAP